MYDDIGVCAGCRESDITFHNHIPRVVSSGTGAKPPSAVIGKARHDGVALHRRKAVARLDEKPEVLVGVPIGVPQHKREVVGLGAVGDIQTDSHGISQRPALLGQVMMRAANHIAAAGCQQKRQA